MSSIVSAALSSNGAAARTVAASMLATARPVASAVWICASRAAESKKSTCPRSAVRKRRHTASFSCRSAALCRTAASGSRRSLNAIRPSRIDRDRHPARTKTRGARTAAQSFAAHPHHNAGPGCHPDAVRPPAFSAPAARSSDAVADRLRRGQRVALDRQRRRLGFQRHILFRHRIEIRKVKLRHRRLFRLRDDRHLEGLRPRVIHRIVRLEGARRRIRPPARRSR